MNVSRRNVLRGIGAAAAATSLASLEGCKSKPQAQEQAPAPATPPPAPRKGAKFAITASGVRGGVPGQVRLLLEGAWILRNDIYHSGYLFAVAPYLPNHVCAVGTWGNNQINPLGGSLPDTNITTPFHWRADLNGVDPGTYSSITTKYADPSINAGRFLGQQYTVSTGLDNDLGLHLPCPHESYPAAKLATASIGLPAIPTTMTFWVVTVLVYNVGESGSLTLSTGDGNDFIIPSGNDLIFRRFFQATNSMHDDKQHVIDMYNASIKRIFDGSMVNPLQKLTLTTTAVITDPNCPISDAELGVQSPVGKEMDHQHPTYGNDTFANCVGGNIVVGSDDMS